MTVKKSGHCWVIGKQNMKVPFRVILNQQMNDFKYMQDLFTTKIKISTSTLWWITGASLPASITIITAGSIKGCYSTGIKTFILWHVRARLYRHVQCLRRLYRYRDATIGTGGKNNSLSLPVKDVLFYTSMITYPIVSSYYCTYTRL